MLDFMKEASTVFVRRIGWCLLWGVLAAAMSGTLIISNNIGNGLALSVILGLSMILSAGITTIAWVVNETLKPDVNHLFKMTPVTDKEAKEMLDYLKKSNRRD